MKSINIIKAINILREGGVVAFPTETVYGLGGDARSEKVLNKIFALKKRPLHHPLIVHLAHLDELSEWAICISYEARKLAETFWPGPLTLVLQKHPQVLPQVTGGQATIGLRIPAHPLAQELLQGFGSGLAAPSANQFTQVSPTDAASVYEELGEEVDYILDGGSCLVGVESTIIDMSSDEPNILRPGMISAKEIEDVLGHPVFYQKDSKIHMPGMHRLHYAPKTQTTLIESENIAAFLQSLPENDLVALITHSTFNLSCHKNVKHIHLSSDAKEYAHHLYRTLRFLDNKKVKRIMIEAPPHSANWDAIRDRLTKASSK